MLKPAISILALLVVVAFLYQASQELRPFGEKPEVTAGGNETAAPMDTYIIDNARNDTGANNAVTAVVFDYRGFDTLGEATVLFTAVSGVAALLWRRDEE